MFELIAGPCVIESAQHAYGIAKELKSICAQYEVPLTFKASFDKANRTELTSYRGPRLKLGLEILGAIKSDLGLKVTSDIHEPAQAALAVEVLDIVQIPAFLCRQTDLLIAAGNTGKIVNIKKGQFMAPQAMRAATQKVLSTGNQNIWITERGTCFGYNDLVVDFRAFDVLGDLGFPIVFDASHSSKNSKHIETLCKAAVAIGVHKLFIEVHENPELALSDGTTSLRLDALPALLKKLVALG